MRRASRVAQAFQPASSRDFPVPFEFETGDWKVARTRRLESLRYDSFSVADGKSPDSVNAQPE